jgi:ribosome recycling factor
MPSPTFSEHISNTLEHLKKEFAVLRTGRANPALIEDLMVEAYGTMTPLQQLGSISAPEPRLLVVQPWDASVIKDIEKALSQSSLGVTPVVDGKIIRLPLPAMTEERRIAMSKTVQEKAEEARVRVRGAREEEMKTVKQQEQEGELSEDAAEIEREHIQKSVEDANQKIHALAEEKIEEIMTV